MQFYRSQLPAATLTAEKALKSPGSILFAGQILRPHRPPTKSGNPVVFFVMEDETGQVDVTYFPRGKQLPIREGGIALVSGTIDKERASNLLLNDLTYLGAPRQV
jgi:error-prone DNA polymerase